MKLFAKKRKKIFFFFFFAFEIEMKYDLEMSARKMIIIPEYDYEWWKLIEKKFPTARIYSDHNKKTK